MTKQRFCTEKARDTHAEELRKAGFTVQISTELIDGGPGPTPFHVLESTKEE